MVTIYHWILIASWTAFVLYWLYAGASAKRSVQTGSFARSAFVRVLLIAAAALVIWRFSGGLPVHAVVSPEFALVPALGAACAVIGIAIAIWARVYLGRNWGMPMTLREDPELVTSGPYAYVRHPIYTGVLLALLGSVLVAGPAWIIVFAAYAIYFFLSAKREEKDMLVRFPDTYPAYKARTTMLVPFIL